MRSLVVISRVVIGGFASSFLAVFFSTLTDTGYRGPVCVEVEDRAYEESVEDCKLALVQSHDFLRNYVPGAKLL